MYFAYYADLRLKQIECHNINFLRLGLRLLGGASRFALCGSQGAHSGRLQRAGGTAAQQLHRLGGWSAVEPQAGRRPRDLGEGIELGGANADSEFPFKNLH